MAKEQKAVPLMVKSSLGAVLLSCPKDQKGIKQTNIEKEYYKLTNTKLDVKKYGYKDLYEFLLAIPDVARLEYSVKDRENKVFGVADKTVFMSDHAKKAAGIPNGLKPLPPSEWPRNKASKDRTVVEDKTSLKVTVESDEKKKIVPNARGLYTLHIRNLPSGCQENEVSRIFIKQYRSLKEVKIENSNRAAFVRFSNYADAVRALRDMNGYNLRGSTLRINPGIERNSQQNAKVSKDRKGELPLKVDMAKRNKSTVITNGFVDKNAVVTELKPGSSINMNSPLPKEMKKVENWETGSELSPKMFAGENKKFFSQDNFDSCVYKEDGGYPIHVSNFASGTTQESLKRMFSTCGDIVHVKLNEKFAFIYFNEQEEAVTALQKMQCVKVGDKKLTVTPRTTPKGKAKQQDDLSAAGSGLHHASNQSSVSSCDSSTPKSPVRHSMSDAACGIGANTNGYTLTEIHNDVTGNGYRGSSSNVGQKQESYSNVSNISNAGIASKEVGKLEESKSTSCSFNAVAENGCPSFNKKPHISPSGKQKVPVHTLLTHAEMRELATRCKKPLITLDNIGAQEFDILVTDVIDSCHFWANIDDQIGSYKKLEQIRTDLQIVEHHERCMPVKYQLGASRFSEDKLWYRCWCLEVSKLERREAKVFYIDYGNGEWISWDQFTDIHKKFWDLAPQAVPFKLAGLENASNLSPEILNEGSKYLDALIRDKVCRARTCQPSDPNKPHIIEVELIIKKEGNVPVNKQMALTRYVQETRNAPHVVQRPLHNHSIQEINLTPSQQQTTSTLQPQQPAMQTAPCGPFVNTQNAQAQPQQPAKQTSPRPFVNTQNAQAQPQQPAKQTSPLPFVNTQNAQAQPQQPAKQTPPQPFVNTQNAQAQQQTTTTPQPQQPAKQTSLRPFVNTQNAQAQPQTTMTPQPQQPAKQTSPRPFVNTQNAQGTQAAVKFAKPVQQSMNHQEPLPSKQSEHSQQSSESRLANSPQSGQDRIGQQSLQQDQKVEPVDKSPPRTLQHQQQLPSYMYQLFEKKEVMKIMLSYVISPDEIYFFMADYKTQQNLRRMSRALVNDVNPKAKIYPRVGDIVIRISERGRFYRVRIRSIPKSAALGVDKVAIQSVDYGWRELAPLSSLCELPPQSLRSLPPQVMHAKLAGIKRKQGMPCYQDVVMNSLNTVKSRREVIQASVVKRQEDGILLVELFESEGPSLNVQFLKMNWAQLDESQRSLFCANFTSSSSDDFGLSPTQRSNNLPLTSNQIPKWHPQENIHHIDNQSNHSDWEDSLIEIEEDWMDATPMTGASKDASRRQSWDHLYIPPPPEMHSPLSAGFARSVPLGTLPSSDIHPPSLGGSVSSGTHDIQAPSAAASSVPHNVRLPTSGGLGSASSGPLGLPPPSDIRPSSSEGSVSSGTHDMRPPSTATSASSVPPNVRLPSAAASSAPFNVRPPSSGGSGLARSGLHDLRSPSTATPASSVPPNAQFPSASASASSVPFDARSPSSGGSGLASSGLHDLSSPSSSVRLPSAAATASSGLPDIRRPSSGASVSSGSLDIWPSSSSGSESGDVSSHTSSQSMRGAVQQLNATKTEYGTALDREDKFLQDKRVVQHSVEKESAEQKDWMQERNELLEKDEELKRILDMPRSEMMKMISLRQEKEKLERKIRMKGLENKILKLRKELSQLELAKGDLELDMSPK